MALRHALLATSLLALTLACGGGANDLAGLQQAYDAGDYATVETEAPKVLKAAKAADAPANDLWQIEKLKLQALARQGKGEAAAAQLAHLKATYPDKVDAPLYVSACNWVKDAPVDGAPAEAVTVLDAGMKQYPEHKDIFGKLVEQIAASGDAEANAKLKSLGYL